MMRLPHLSGRLRRDLSQMRFLHHTGNDAVGRSVIRELFDKAPKVVPGKDWQTHFAFFARAGFTDAARAEAEARDAILVDLEQMDADLHQALLAG